MGKGNGHFFPDLETAAIGRPITRAGISFFPVYLMADGLPEIATAGRADRRRMAVAGPRAARAPRHRFLDVQALGGPGPRSRMALYEREGRRPGARPRGSGRPHFGHQPVGAHAHRDVGVVPVRPTFARNPFYRLQRKEKADGMAG